MNPHTGAQKSTLGRIPRKPLKQAVIDQIQTAIERGELKAGERVTELGLASRLGVPQPTIREALIELENRGFVQRRIPRKTFITALTHRDIAEIYRLRLTLETLAVRLVIEAGNSHLDAPEKAYQEMLEHAKESHLPDFLRADLTFHRTLWQATQNRHLAGLLELLVPKLFAFGIIQHARPCSERLREVAEMHGRLLIQIRAGREHDAVAIMERLLQQAQLDDSQLPEKPLDA